MKMIKKGVVIFQYDNISIKAHCIVEEDGNVEHDILSVNNAGQLSSATVILQDGSEFDLCNECNTHIIKKIMVQNQFDHCLQEVKECTNPECTNKALLL